MPQHQKHPLMLRLFFIDYLLLLRTTTTTTPMINNAAGMPITDAKDTICTAAVV